MEQWSARVAHNHEVARFKSGSRYHVLLKGERHLVKTVKDVACHSVRGRNDFQMVIPPRKVHNARQTANLRNPRKHQDRDAHREPHELHAPDTAAEGDEKP